MENPKISVIIPLYNNELFFGKCMDSLIAQTVNNFEVIIIDDKSTDSSLKIANKYKENFEYVKIISLKVNGGVSNARNVGLNCAKGDYIFFLDSDDFIKPNFLEIMYKSIKKLNADIICCNYFYVNKKNHVRKNLIHHRPGKYSSDIITHSLIKDTNLHFFVWNKLFKRDIIFKNHIFFENTCFEDMVFTLKTFYFADKVLIIDEFLYYYRKHDSSLTNFMSFGKLDTYLTSLKLIKLFLLDKNIYEIYKQSYKYLVLRFFISCFYRIPQMFVKSESKPRLKEISYVFSKIKKLLEN